MDPSADLVAIWGLATQVINYSLEVRDARNHGERLTDETWRKKIDDMDEDIIVSMSDVVFRFAGLVTIQRLMDGRVHTSVELVYFTTQKYLQWHLTILDSKLGFTSLIGWLLDIRWCRSKPTRSTRYQLP
jgi:hypothetical protein